MANISKKFVDINPSFQKHPITGDITLLKNEDAIKQSVKNIVMTMRGEKSFVLSLEQRYKVLFLKILTLF